MLPGKLPAISGDKEMLIADDLYDEASTESQPKKMPIIADLLKKHL